MFIIRPPAQMAIIKCKSTVTQRGVQIPNIQLSDDRLMTNWFCSEYIVHTTQYSSTKTGRCSITCSRLSLTRTQIAYAPSQSSAPSATRAAAASHGTSNIAQLAHQSLVHRRLRWCRVVRGVLWWCRRVCGGGGGGVRARCTVHQPQLTKLLLLLDPTILRSLSQFTRKSQPVKTCIILFFRNYENTKLIRNYFVKFSFLYQTRGKRNQQICFR